MFAWVDKTLFFALIPSSFMVISAIFSLVEDNVENEIKRIGELSAIADNYEKQQLVVKVVSGAISVNNFLGTLILTFINVIVLVNSILDQHKYFVIINTIAVIVMLIIILIALQYLRRYDYLQLVTYIPDTIPMNTKITYSKWFSICQLSINVIFFIAIIAATYVASFP